jgi:CheY-like chemotaxis protein
VDSTLQPLVLVCEDDPIVSQLFADVLEAAGYRTAQTYDGESAVHLAAELRPTVITLDIDLPSLDGVAVAHRLKLNPTTAAVPLIFISAHPGWLTFRERQHAAAVLQKPFPAWELESAVDQAVAAAAAA